MANRKKIDEVEFLAIWLYGAADQAGQLETVRKLIRSAALDSQKMYGLPGDGEADDPQDIPTIIGKFAAAWDEFDRQSRAV